jgi:hypothetical protein
MILMAEQTRPSESVIKRLFARSGNRCAYPKCNAEIVHRDTVVGQMCHIKAANENGPRYDRQQSAADRHGYGNLILLCANHHTVIDDDPEAFSVERLLKMKDEHENRSTPLAADNVERATRLLVDQSVTSQNQFGGITANTVNQTFNVLAPVAAGDETAAHREHLTRLHQFHDDRVTKIASGEGPVALLKNGALVIHVLPFASLDRDCAESFDDISRNPGRFPPIGGTPLQVKIDYDGLLIGSNARGFPEAQRAYVMVFRSGAVEAVVSSLGRGHESNFFALLDIQAIIIQYAHIYGTALKDFDILPPLGVFVCLIDVQGKTLLQGSFQAGAFPEDLPSAMLNRAQLPFGVCVFDSVPMDDSSCAKVLKPILDHLANAAGLPASPLFDPEGNYIGR